jgi:hypothetical protein
MLKLAPPRPRKERAASTGALGLGSAHEQILLVRSCSIVSKTSEMLAQRGEKVWLRQKDVTACLSISIAPS